jgi:hypothetical protein
MCLIEVFIAYKALDKLTINKYPRMNKQLKRVGSSVVTGTCVVLGAIHFIAQSTADVVSEAEAKLIRNRDGVDPEHTKKERMYKTIGAQMHIKDKAAAFKKAVNEAKARVRGEYVADDSNHQAIANIILVNAEVIRSEA